MLQRQSKNNDLVIEVQGAGISKIEYYTDGLYKYMVDYSPIVYIPSSELQKMNDGQLRSTVYLSTPDNNFDDGSKDKTIDQTFNIWIGSGSISPNVNEYYTKDEVDKLIQSVDLSDYYTKDEVDEKIAVSGTFDESQYYTKSEIDGRFDNIVTEIPEEYITESELTKDYYNKSEIDNKGYLTEHQSLEGYALKSEIPDTTGLATKTELTTAIGNIDTILDNINGEIV